MIDATLPSFAQGFFSAWLRDLPNAPSLESLRPADAPDRLTVRAGDYIAYDGADVTAFGQSFHPRFVLRFVADQMTWSGTGDGRTFTLPSAQPSLSRNLLWLQERGDVATDSVETLTRIFADLRPVGADGASGAGAAPDAGSSSSSSSSAATSGAPGASSSSSGAAAGGAPTSGDLARRWAAGLKAAASTLTVNVNTIAAVPAGVPAADVQELRTMLQHFCTYAADGSYYAKGTVQEGHFPDGASPAYLRANVREVLLRRDQSYVYVLVPESLGRPGAAAGTFREAIYRIDDRGDAAPSPAARFTIALLHTAQLQLRGADGNAAGDSFDFVFFHASDGTGIAVPATVSAAAANAAENVPTNPTAMAAAIADPGSPLIGTAAAPLLLLLGRVTGSGPLANLPPGVTESGDGSIRVINCPPDQLAALAVHPQIVELEPSTRLYPSMVDVSTAINLPAHYTNLGTTKATAGRGVVIGFVDTGIDGTHATFLGRADDPTKPRIHAVWHQWDSSGTTPRANAPAATQAAYNGMTYGTELTGNNVTSSVDSGGHGTHVAGIAAGQPVGAWPGGVAQAATIVFVSTDWQTGHLIDGVRYCFQKARELGLPCVVNMSLGNHDTAHDGTDQLAAALTELVTFDSLGSETHSKIICAAAHNHRHVGAGTRNRWHWDADIAPGTTATIRFVTTGGDEKVTLWANANDNVSPVRLATRVVHATNAALASSVVSLQPRNGAVTSALAGGLAIDIHNGPPRRSNGHNNIDVVWRPPVASAAASAGEWILTFRNDGRSNVTIHGWSAKFNGSFKYPTAAEEARCDSYKVTTPASAIATISVASFTSRPAPGSGAVVGNLSSFSSPGPLRAVARRAIDVTAPGEMVTSAKAGGGLVDMAGTSMATPVVTGLVADLLQQNNGITVGDIRTRLEVSSARPAGGRPEDWGLGKIDASKFKVNYP